MAARCWWRVASGWWQQLVGDLPVVPSWATTCNCRQSSTLYNSNNNKRRLKSIRAVFIWHIQNSDFISQLSWQSLRLENNADIHIHVKIHTFMLRYTHTCKYTHWTWICSLHLRNWSIKHIFYLRACTHTDIYFICQHRYSHIHIHFSAIYRDMKIILSLTFVTSLLSVRLLVFACRYFACLCQNFAISLDISSCQ